MDLYGFFIGLLTYSTPACVHGWPLFTLSTTKIVLLI